MDSRLAAFEGNGELELPGDLLGFTCYETGMLGTEGFGRSLTEQSKPPFKVLALE